MNQALTALQRTAEIAEHNLPYSEQAGDIAQAELQRTTSAECRQAIEQLQEETTAKAD
ncbi:hypothetical protein [Pseudomonas peli]|uniref:hypothetical protein n=1 Tax=Pseudomonas peli TaxID=592361 RepID=UPI0028615C93|nr:hypothetical protein [Pseudomonas peli]MDR7024395.1 hypothetical protein [Pseudomonas peli]